MTTNGFAPHSPIDLASVVEDFSAAGLLAPSSASNGPKRRSRMPPLDTRAAGQVSYAFLLLQLNPALDPAMSTEFVFR
jgi:hypothetical protein